MDVIWTFNQHFLQAPERLTCLDITDIQKTVNGELIVV